MDFQPGDIAIGVFEYDEGKAFTTDVHPMLVLETKMGGCVVAFGTSHLREPLPTEFILTEEEARACGLHKPTMFCLERRDSIPNNLSHQAWHKKLRNIQHAGDAVMLKFFKAARAAGLV